MPYQWTDTPEGPVVLTLTAHNSLSPKGFVLMISLTAGLIALPLVSVLGTVLLWWMLPFLIAALAALWFALKRSYRDRQVHEVLEREGDVLTLTHYPSHGAPLRWECNVYWARAEIHPKGGPVDHYIVLSGNGRAVELGRFLSVEERESLFNEITEYLKAHAKR